MKIQDFRWVTYFFSVFAIIWGIVGAAEYMLSGPVRLSEGLNGNLWIAIIHVILALLSGCAWWDMKRLRDKHEREAALYEAYVFVMKQE